MGERSLKTRLFGPQSHKQTHYCSVFQIWSHLTFEKPDFFSGVSFGLIGSPTQNRKSLYRPRRLCLAKVIVVYHTGDLYGDPGADNSEFWNGTNRRGGKFVAFTIRCIHLFVAFIYSLLFLSRAREDGRIWLDKSPSRGTSSNG